MAATGSASGAPWRLPGRLACPPSKCHACDGTPDGSAAFYVVMSRPHHDEAERASLAALAETDRQARAEKNARLRRLRTHASWLVLDPDALFRDEIDCSALFNDIPMRKATRPG